MVERVAETQRRRSGAHEQTAEHLPTRHCVRRNENSGLVFIIVESHDRDWHWTLLSSHNGMYIRGKGLLQDEYKTFV